VTTNRPPEQWNLTGGPVARHRVFGSEDAYMSTNFLFARVVVETLPQGKNGVVEWNSNRFYVYRRRDKV